MVEQSEDVHAGDVNTSEDDFIPWCVCGWQGTTTSAPTPDVHDDAHLKAYEDAYAELSRHMHQAAGHPRCDQCKMVVHPDANGWWVAADETADCMADEGGHMVSGSQRA